MDRFSDTITASGMRLDFETYVMPLFLSSCVHKSNLIWEEQRLLWGGRWREGGTGLSHFALEGFGGTHVMQWRELEGLRGSAPEMHAPPIERIATTDPYEDLCCTALYDFSIPDWFIIHPQKFVLDIRGLGLPVEDLVVTRAVAPPDDASALGQPRSPYPCDDARRNTSSRAFCSVSDVNKNETVYDVCSRFGHVLREVATNTASSQDPEATGVSQSALLSARPSLVSTTEMVLSVVTAVQGLVAAAILLFQREKERLRSAVNWYRRARGQEALPNFPGASTPPDQLRLARCLLMLLALVVVVYVPFSGCGAFWTLEHEVSSV